MAQDQTPIPPVSILVASFNEEKNIEQTINRIYAALPNCELILIEGGTDRTRDIAHQLKEQKYPHLVVVHNKNDRGKGHAIREGIHHATHPVMAQVDADCQFLPEELHLILKPVLAGEADIVFGSRFMKNSTNNDPTLRGFRHFANYIDSLFTSILSGKRYTDVQAGFKAWKSAVIKDLNIQCDHFGYEPEIAVRAAKKNYTILEIPITYEGRSEEFTKVRLVRDGLKIITYLLKVKLFE